MRSFPPEELYYITHIDNLRSILEKGILSHERIEQLELGYTSVYSEEVVSICKNKLTPAGKSLWHYANLYFQPRNPMMYSVVNTKNRDKRLVLVDIVYAKTKSLVSISGRPKLALSKTLKLKPASLSMIRVNMPQ